MIDMMFSELNRGLKARANPDVEFDPLELARVIFPWEWIKYQRELLHTLLSDSWTRLVVLAPPRHRKPLWVKTNVLTPNGYKRLGDIEVGDEVITKRNRKATVTAVHDQGELPTMELVTESGEFLYAAPDHPILTPDGWRMAVDLDAGDYVMRLGNKKPHPVKLISVRTFSELPCRCLSVSRDASFVANDIIVHNTSIVSLFAAISLGLDNTNRIMFASHTRDYSALMMNQVEEIMKTPAYRRIFGDILPKQLYASSDQSSSRSLTISNVRWATYERHLPNRPPRIKDPTMLAISPDSGTPGFGASIIICFPPDTPIITPNGQQPISTLTIGDRVLTHKGRFMEITRTYVRPYTGELITINGISMTPNHPILVQNGLHREWRRADQISIGDTLITPSQRCSKVTLLQQRKHYSGRVYNLEVAQDHSYATPAFFAHNCDDLVSQANSSSPTRRKHLEHWFKASLLKRLDPDGKILVVGARFYKHDLYGTLLDEGWEHIILRASPEKPLWPQKWPAALLEQKRQEDPVFFPAQYLQDPQDVEGAGLDPSWFSFYIEPPDEMAIFAGVDPGITDSKGSKTAYVIVGRSVNGEILLLDGDSKLMRGGQLLELINTIQERYKPVAIGFESNGPQQSIMELIINSSDLQPGTNLMGVPSLTSKYLRMSSLAAYARSGRLKLPGSLTKRGEIEPDQISKRFLSAWASFPSGDTDLLDAYDKAVQLALQGPPPAVAKPDPNRDRRIVKQSSGPAFRRVFRDRRRIDDEI